MTTVLVIEDNDNNMELISFMLQANEFSVLKAYRGQQGIDMALTNKPDLVLLDIQLPDIDGTQVLAELRRNQDFAATPIIAVTSYAMTGDSKMLLGAGCDGYIEKPIDPDRFIDQINTVLAERV